MHLEHRADVSVWFKDTIARNVAREKRLPELQNFTLGPEFSFHSDSFASQIRWLSIGLRERSSLWSRFREVASLLPPIVTDRDSLEPVIEKRHEIINLFGHWITPKYFDLHATSIISRIRPRSELPERLESVVGKAGAANAIAIHVRRGDYFSQSLVGTYGLLTSEYYVKSTRLLAEMSSCAKPHLFIFTDDAEWAETRLQPLLGLGSRVKVIAESPGENAAQHLWTMSRFRNLVLSNSTFSWWAAHLGPSKAAVVSPENWGPKLAGTELIRANWITT